MATPEEIARDLVLALIEKRGVEPETRDTYTDMSRSVAEQAAEMFRIIYRAVRDETRPPTPTNLTSAVE